MKILLSYVAARNRATGEIESLIHLESLIASQDVSPVQRKIDEFTGGTPEGAELRARYSHVLAVVENQERQTLEFPDPAIALRQQKGVALAAAQKAADDLAASEQAARTAAANVKTIMADRKEADARVVALEAELARIVPAPAAPLLPPPPVVELPPPPPETPAEELTKLNDDQLAAVAATYSIPTPVPLDRETIIAAILASAPQ